MTAPHGLTFLRVFSLGTRSNALLESIGKHWRSIGSIQLITGPDVAHSTVQPHQLLDFLSGRLAGHFIGDARSLEDRLKRQDRAADRDGWYRVNSFFCRADAWQAALAKLVGEGDAILMDLRSFSSRNAGCVHELRHLIHRIPNDAFSWSTNRPMPSTFAGSSPKSGRPCKSTPRTGPQNPECCRCFNSMRAALPCAHCFSACAKRPPSAQPHLACRKQTRARPAARVSAFTSRRQIDPWPFPDNAPVTPGR